MQKLFFLVSRLVLPTALFVAAAPLCAQSDGPIIYGAGPGGVIYQINLDLCVACPVLNYGNTGSPIDIVAVPSGNFLLIASKGIRVFTVSPPSTSTTYIPGSSGFSSGIVAPNGQVYLAGASGLSLLDPSSNAITSLGTWPPDVVINGELYYLDGILYIPALAPGPVTLQVDVNDPEQSTILPGNTQISGTGGWTNGGYTNSVGPGNVIYQYNPTSNAIEPVCDLQPFGITSLFGLTAVPPGGTPVVCACTNAGELTPSPQQLTACINETAILPAVIQPFLEPGDVQRYVLYTSPFNPAGSIIAISPTPSFVFDPAIMQTNVPYFFASVAGSGVNGGIDLGDPCLDFSGARFLTWRSLPELTLSLVGTADVCPGACVDVQAQATGGTGFNYTVTYNYPGGTVTQQMPISGVVQLCVPPNAAVGPFQIQATVTDGQCTCSY